MLTSTTSQRRPNKYGLWVRSYEADWEIQGCLQRFPLDNAGRSKAAIKSDRTGNGAGSKGALAPRFTPPPQRSQGSLIVRHRDDPFESVERCEDIRTPCTGPLFLRIFGSGTGRDDSLNNCAWRSFSSQGGHVCRKYIYGTSRSSESLSKEVHFRESRFGAAITSNLSAVRDWGRAIRDWRGGQWLRRAVSGWGGAASGSEGAVVRRGNCEIITFEGIAVS